MADEKKISKKNPFRVPENYFEEVNRRIIDATSGSEPVRGRERAISFTGRFRRFAIPAAAAAVLLIAVLAAVKLGINHESDTLAANSILQNELLIDEFDIATLEGMAGEDLSSDAMNDDHNSEIIEFLISENIDISLIYEHL